MRLTSFTSSYFLTMNQMTMYNVKQVGHSDESTENYHQLYSSTELLCFF